MAAVASILEFCPDKAERAAVLKQPKAHTFNQVLKKRPERLGKCPYTAKKP
jgi:hypothetical protein